jgi:hypothetical protein
MLRPKLRGSPAVRVARLPRDAGTEDGIGQDPLGIGEDERRLSDARTAADAVIMELMPAIRSARPYSRQVTDSTA